mmetsp:Transcript_31441/g.41637  ORF Transcript_31441/g.41637 Transcript_31441/m.41637 type:complete len:152 (-) Transcript_31441:459-914(-)
MVEAICDREERRQREHLARRIVVGNHLKQKHEVNNLVERVLSQRLPVRSLPTREQLFEMTRTDLLKVLVECPESPFFALEEEPRLDKTWARRIVLGLLNRSLQSLEYEDGCDDSRDYSESEEDVRMNEQVFLNQIEQKWAPAAAALDVDNE